MDQENVEYLKNLAERAEFYFNIRIEAIKYFGKNKVGRLEILESLILTGVLWAAHKRNEFLTEDDICLLLGISNDNIGNKTILKLHHTLQELTLEEIFDRTVENFK